MIVTLVLNEEKEFQIPPSVWSSSNVLKGFVEITQPGQSSLSYRYSIPFDEYIVQLWYNFCVQQLSGKGKTKLPEIYNNISYASEMLRLCHFLDIRALYHLLIDRTATIASKGTQLDVASKLELKHTPSLDQQKQIQKALKQLDDDQ